MQGIQWVLLHTIIQISVPGLAFSQLLQNKYCASHPAFAYTSVICNTVCCLFLTENDAPRI